MKSAVYAVFLVLGSVFCRPAFAADTPLKVGAVLYLTNYDYSNVAVEFKHGLELAAADIGAPVELFIEDDQGVTKNTATATQKLININHVNVVFYAEYVQVQVGAPIASRAGAPSMVIWESSPEIESLGEHVFGLGLWQPSAGSMPAKYAAEKLHAKTAALIYDLSPWSANVAKYFTGEFKKAGGRIVLEDTYPKGETDFRSSIAKLKNLDADVVFAPVSEHPVAFFKQLRQAKFDRPVLSSDQISREFIEAAGGALEGVVFSNADDRLNPKLEKLRADYEARFGAAPSNIHLVGLAYDAMMVVETAWIKRGQMTLNAALAAHGNFDGVLGSIQLNESRTFRRPEVIYVVKDGKAEHSDP